MTIPWSFHMESMMSMEQWIGCGPSQHSFHGFHMDSIWINPGKVKTSLIVIHPRFGLLTFLIISFILQTPHHFPISTTDSYRLIISPTPFSKQMWMLPTLYFPYFTALHINHNLISSLHFLSFSYRMIAIPQVKIRQNLVCTAPVSWLWLYHACIASASVTSLDVIGWNINIILLLK